MAFIDLTWKRIHVQPFSTAVFVSLMSVVGSALIVKCALDYNTGTLRNVLLVAAGLIVGTMLTLLFRLRQAFKTAYPQAVAGNEPAAQALNVAIRSYTWGNVVVLLLGIGLIVLRH